MTAKLQTTSLLAECALLPEKLLQQVATLIFEDAADDRRAVVQSGVVGNLK